MSTPDAEPVLLARGLRAGYGDHEVLHGVDLRVDSGEIVAVLGPNGAGKTTMMETLEGFRRPSGGEVRVLGADPHRAGRRWRERVGVVLQQSEPERHLTLRQCLRLYAGYYPNPRDVEETMGLVGLTELAGRRGARLSGGERRRVDVALALIGDPELIFLDEPTTGFDPVSRRRAWDMIAGLRDLGKTVLLTTHQMEEAESLADRIVVLAEGRVLSDGPPDRVGGRDRMPTQIRLVCSSAAEAARAPGALAALGGGAATAAGGAAADPTTASLAAPGPEATAPLAERLEVDGTTVSFSSTDPLGDIGALAAWASGSDVEIVDLHVAKPGLEQVYFALVGMAQ